MRVASVVIINDCLDSNAAGRQVARTSSILGAHTSFIGVSSTLEAAGSIVDALDAMDGRAGVVLCNVAPRGGEKKWENGSPFAYFFHDYKTVVITTIDGFTLSLAKKLNMIFCAHVVDMRKAVESMGDFVGHPESFRTGRVFDTQFRSYEFAPHLARLLVCSRFVPHKWDASSPLCVDDIPSPPSAVWWVDNFGNCKTTLLYGDMQNSCGAFVEPGSMIQVIVGEFPRLLPYFPRLKDVPDGKPAIVEGSSGFRNQRFFEIVVRGGSAADLFRLSSGSPFVIG